MTLIVLVSTLETSRTFWINNANRLIRRSNLQLGKVVVLYFGGYDPSGNKMVKKLKKMLGLLQKISRPLKIQETNL